MSGWIAVDFDGTLAEYDGWKGDQLGEPVQPMLDRVRKWIDEGKEVRIFTARVGATGLTVGTHADDKDFAMSQRILIQDWCEKHGLPRLKVTATKDFGMTELWDDRAVQVEMNKGTPVGYSTRGNTEAA